MVQVVEKYREHENNCVLQIVKKYRVNVDTNIIVTADGTLSVKSCTLTDTK